MIWLVIITIILFIVFLKTHSKHKSPAAAAIINMVLGVLSLSIAAPFADAAVNVYTVFTALTLGVPGTVLVILCTTLL
jgi:hypothetical protein